MRCKMPLYPNKVTSLYILYVFILTGPIDSKSRFVSLYLIGFIIALPPLSKKKINYEYKHQLTLENMEIIESYEKDH